jgi:hypothetical protein
MASNTSKSMQGERPDGITTIGVLDIVGDSFFLIGALVVFIGIPTIAYNPEDWGIESNSFALKLFTHHFGYAVVSGLAGLGIANTFASIGFLMGKKWAWKLTMVLAVISAATDITIVVLDVNTSSLVSAIIGCIIDAVILYYLYRPNVKSYFGKTIRKGAK